MAGQGQRACPLHPRGLDEEDFATDGGPGHSNRHARILRALLDFLVKETRSAQELDNGVARELDGLLAPFGPAPCDLPYQRCELTLEIADSRLARIPANDQADGVV